MRSLFFTAFILVVALVAYDVHAQTMSSGSYQIQSDSVNFGGGLSSSTNYNLESTGGEIATGPSESTTYKLKAGYQQMQEVYLALSGIDNVIMESMDGIGGDQSNGSTTVTAITDSPSGYQLTIEASASPALSNGSETIADYVPAGSAPDLHFTTGNTDAYFGYSPFGTDVAQRFQTNGSVCSVSGSASSTACWDGLSTTPKTIAQSTSPNHPSGTDTTIYFKVGVGPSVVQTAGTYVATTTITLLSL